MGKTKRRGSRRKAKHGPRYSVKGKPKAWVERGADGRFKRWVGKKRSLASDRVWKAPKGRHAGYGATKDY